MRQLHPFLQQYKVDHERFLEALTTLHAQKNWSDFFDFAAAEIQTHQLQQEELILFKAIAEKAGLRSGGPLCMLYFDLHSQNHPLASSAAACNETRIEPRKHAKDHRKTFFDTSSPVFRPIEDHMALEQIQRHATRGPHSEDHLAVLAATYLKILRMHFEKEDQCFLPMCASLFSEQELNALAGEPKVLAKE